MYVHCKLAKKNLCYDPTHVVNASLSTGSGDYTMKPMIES